MTDRERFEAFVVAQGLPKPLRRPNGDYWSSHVHIAWAFWQASRNLALQDAMAECNRQADHETDMGRTKEAFGCDLCVGVLSDLANPEGEQG